MSIQQLDFIFPFVVLAYGATMTVVLNSDFFCKLARKKFPPALFQQLNSHRGIGLVCLVVGSLWSLQNIWLSTSI